MLKIYAVTNFSPKKIAAQLPKAIALATTQTSTNSQEEIQKELPKQFTIRGPWWKKGNKFGIKVRPAEKSHNPINGEVGTNADWLALHETSGTKKRKSRGRAVAVSSSDESFAKFVTGKSLLAIPTKNVRRTARQIIQKRQKPFNLKRAFAVKTKQGNILIMARTGRGKKSKALPYYFLRQTAQIDKSSTVIEPTIRTVARKLNPNFGIAMRRVLTKEAKKRI